MHAFINIIILANAKIALFIINLYFLIKGYPYPSIADRSVAVDFKTLDNTSTISIINDNSLPTSCSTLKNISTTSVINNVDSFRTCFINYWLVLID